MLEMVWQPLRTIEPAVGKQNGKLVSKWALSLYIDRTHFV